MTGRLADKIAIITGSSRGLGREIALRFHHEGAVVVCADLLDIDDKIAEGEAQVPPTHEVIVQEGGLSIFVKTDITKAEEMIALVEGTVQKYGRLDIMINNAGILAEALSRKPIWDFDEPIFDTDMQVNVKGTLLGTKYAAKQMITQDAHPSGPRGWIVNIASILGFRGELTLAGYVSSKHAILGLTKTAALDCGPYRINVNAVCPGYLNTRMTEPIRTTAPKVAEYIAAKHPYNRGGFGSSSDIVGMVLYLVSEENVWMTGSCAPVDGGYSAR